MKNEKARIPRVQSGNIHVYIRGNSRYNVFYDDNDRTEFLSRCYCSAEKHMVTIYAFVIMDNHVHLQISTDKLSKFVRDFLQGYSQWYNHKHGLSDKLFKSPFSSACKYSEKWILDSILYILNNPVKSKICKHPSEYLWSSYSQYFSDCSPLNKYIRVDKFFIREQFKNIYALDKAVINFGAGLNEIKEESNFTWSRLSDSIVSKNLGLILNNRDLFCLTEEEIKAIILTLRNETNASFRQIASLTHTEYGFVRRTLLGKN